MIKSNLTQTSIEVRKNLILPIISNLNDYQKKGSLSYNNNNDELIYSDGSGWIPLITQGNIFPDNVITVHPTSSSADFKTIKEGLEFATSLLPSPSTVLVYPATYIENNPLIVSNGITLLGFGGPLSQNIIAMNPSLTLFNLGNGSVIENFTTIGGNPAVDYDGSTGTKAGGILKACVLIDPTIGVRSCIGPGELFCVQVLVRVNTGTVNIGFEVCTGGKMRCWTSGCFGAGSNIGMGVRCVDTNSLFVFYSGGFQLCDIAGFVNNGGRLEFKSAFVRACTTGLEIGSTGTTSQLLIDGTTFLNTASNSLSVLATDAKITITGGSLQVSKINNPNNVTLFISSFSPEEFNEAFSILGDLHVGSSIEGTESSLGQGDAYTNEIIVMTDNGTSMNFMDVTASAINPNITLPFMQGFSIGNVIYFGSKVPFYGFDINVASTWAIGNSDLTSTQYWNGSWTDVEQMVTVGTSPYGSRTNIILENLEKQRVRFGKMTGWVTNTVNSITAYWVRIIVDSPISAPMATYSLLELHPSSSKINTDGYLEYFGNARPIKSFSWETGLLQPAAASPGDQDVYLSDNLDIGKIENLFQNTAIDRIGFNSYLPSQIDTSYGIKFRWSWISTATGGNINWVIRTGFSQDGFNIYTSTASAPPVGVNEQSVSISYPVTETIGTQVTETQVIIRPKINARPVSGNPDIFWLTLERNGPADSHSGNVALVQVQGEYVAWCEGGHLSNF